MSYIDAEDLLNTLRTQFKESAHVEFHGRYPIMEDNLIKPKEQTHMVGQEIWQLTGYRFT